MEPASLAPRETTCALGIAMPLAFWTALGSAWRSGVLVRGGEVLERLARARRVVFDKTGTLTTREPELVRVEGGNHAFGATHPLRPPLHAHLERALEATVQHLARHLAR